MEINSYEVIKEFIVGKLEKYSGALPQDKIISEINILKGLIATMGLETLAQVLSVDYLEELSDVDWEIMQRELEALFNVKMEFGILIQGEEQQKRDTTWWTSTAKQISENYYWNRYLKQMKRSLPFEVIKTIDVDTDKVMDNIENPYLDDFSRYGMVVGHVQSGKTGNYSALICKAADAGYKFIVVIAGGINNLRNQTQERLNMSFVGVDEGNRVGVGKFAGYIKSKQPASLTTTLQDFNKRDANKNSQSINFDNMNSPIVMVIKKNSKTLLNVISWLEAQYKNQQISKHSMLMIDDESDYASINTKDEDNPTIINERIRIILGMFRKSAYVAYTATPYANIFIDHQVNKENLGKDLFPKDFIYALDAPTNYFGARKIFRDTDFKHIITINPPNELPLNHKKYHNIIELPETLKDAIRLFLINIGIRNLRKQKGKHNSMLVHISRYTMIHQMMGMHIEEYLSSLRKDIISFGILKNPEAQSINIMEMKEMFEREHSNLEFSWNKVIKSITTMIETVIVREVHAQKSIELEYRDDRPTNAIVVGGTSLSRGFTLEGLSISYFLRTTVFYDTLMQMGRWFGYRDNYEDLCRIYMTEDMRDNFKLIIEATEDLFDDFKRMQLEKKTPEDFGLAVRQHPDSGLQVTARNKQKNSKDIYFEMKLDGSAKETSWLYNDIDSRKNNLKAIENTIKLLENDWINNKEVKQKTKTSADYLWREVDKSVVSSFVDEFKVYGDGPFGLKSRMPIDFIRKYIDTVETKWDVAIYSGEEDAYSIIDAVMIRRESRKVENKELYFEIKNRQISSGNSESIALTDSLRKKLNSNRKDIRANLERPLLMLHVLQTDEDDQLAAFGISFPGSITSTGKTVKLKINTVYINEIENMLAEEEYDD